MTTRHLLSVLLLAPLLTAATPDRPATAPDANLSKIKLPAGFTISYFAQGVKSARELAVGPDGTVYVGTKDDKVYALPDRNKDGRADEVVTVATGLNAPNGVAVRNGALYVAEINRILRYDNIAARLRQKPKPAVVYDKLPNKDWHGYRYIAFGPDGKLYVPVGAPCNSCLPEEPIYATINRMNPDGSGLEVFAQGVRNTVGFDWSPQDKALWFTDNGRDMLGDNLPADELNRAATAGLHFGFPYFFAGDVPDPQFSKGRSADTYQKPARKLGPHVAALGMKFYTGKQFPAQYRNQILIPEHGSWNRSNKIGYRIMLVKLDATGKQATSYEPFAEGWLQGQKPWGRPVCLLVLPDGSLLVSDDQNDAVYRISYKG
ncbi:PQQ-dependent sugar dehydrogenase [Hymenobacter psychrotolerans]|uniref:Glucose/arabinose dehydrogenase, beta-propeller fold n=1 Tax=Hymenobacter psychrotolerans DSM 18569 TaxID=1121959 RepID=A0A1M7GTQ0_9BACT|nr:PQQ-dependent sugar dehydrogenase [Hymenobacter psychrotolerans]SHM19590.1 Glucose/arabinose dehydrogenase, beta-propeller fold [Hymenobacter psychrotolerans DSM 18569]